MDCYIGMWWYIPVSCLLLVKITKKEVYKQHKKCDTWENGPFRAYNEFSVQAFVVVPHLKKQFSGQNFCVCL